MNGIIFGLALLQLSTNVVVGNYDQEILLTQKLLTNSSYSKTIRPSDNVTLRLTIFTNQINSIDDSNQLMTSSINIMAEWEDPRLTWDDTSYNSVYYFLVRADLLWQPDLVILNGASSNISLNLDSKNLAYLTSSGLVAVLYSAASLKTRCAIDATMFPFDKQTCSITISSWSMCTDYLTINVDQVVDDFYIDNAVWSLINTTSYNKKERDRFSYIVNTCVNDVVYFNFNIQRRPLYYMINMIAPSLFLTLMTIACFALPPASQFNLSVTIFLSYSISSVRISSQMPVQSTNMPIITWYFLVSMCFTLISFYWFVVDYILRSISYLPNWVSKLCVRVRSFARFVRDRTWCKLRCKKTTKPIKHVEESDPSYEDIKSGKPFVDQEPDCFKCQSCSKCNSQEAEAKLKSQEMAEFDKNMLCLNRLVFSVLFTLIFLFNVICWVCVSLM